MPSRRFALALALLLALPASSGAQEALLGDSDAEQAANVLRELVRIERALLADAEGERAAAVDRLKAASDRLSKAAGGLMTALDELALARAGATDAAAARSSLEEAEKALAAAQTEVEGLVNDSRTLARRLDEHVARLDGLEQRLSSLEQEAPTKRGVLAGLWDLKVSPNGERGTLLIRQFGTLVAGQYELNNGREGSVRGTYTNGHLRLEVIDARFGRDSTFQGLYDEERGLSGTWEAVRLGTGRPAFGDWQATKREEPADSGPAGP